MNILYHLTILPPKMPQCEALSQEISALSEHFCGEICYLNPNKKFLYVPRLLFGFHKLFALRKQESRFHLHHLYNPDPFPFPLIHWLRKPIVYAITGGISDRKPNINYLNRLAAIAVPDERSFKNLSRWGVQNVFLTRTGIDTARFTHTPLPVKKKFHLLMASAPWTRYQFQTKGVDALLQAVQRDPNLYLTFLWRDVMVHEMQKRIHEMGVEEQVTFINGEVDVNQVLASVHATINLATTPGIVKAYPHSLLDSLAAGKPILVSQAIPMADYVTEKGVGEVVKAVTAESILDAVARLRANYIQAQHAAIEYGQTDFTHALMVESHRAMYESISSL